MISDKIIEEYSAKYGIDKYTILREFLQISFMNQLYNNAVFNGDLVFKGGTALRLIYNSKRFSEDLDFNSLVDKQKLENIIKQTLESMNSTIPGLYFKEIESLQGYSAKIYYETLLSKMPLTIKLDFSFREETKTVIQRTTPTELPVSTYSLIKVMTEEEILAEKMRTVFQRSKGRDIYDIWYLLNKKVSLNKSLIDFKFKLIKRDFNKKEFIDIIREFSDADLLQDLNKFLPLSQRDLISHLKELIIEDDSLRQLA